MSVCTSSLVILAFDIGPWSCFFFFFRGDESLAEQDSNGNTIVTYDSPSSYAARTFTSYTPDNIIDNLIFAVELPNAARTHSSDFPSPPPSLCGRSLSVDTQTSPSQSRRIRKCIKFLLGVTVINQYFHNSTSLMISGSNFTLSRESFRFGFNVSSWPFRNPANRLCIQLQYSPAWPYRNMCLHPYQYLCGCSLSHCADRRRT